jgi:hypothetical protein
LYTGEGIPDNLRFYAHFIRGVTTIEGGIIMFGIYIKKTTINEITYEFKKGISLAGCNSGLLPAMVKKIARSGQSEPFIWEINIAKQLRDLEGDSATIIIDIKPNNKKNREVLLCELLDVWGYSASNWTPLLLHMKCLVDQFETTDFVKGKFSIECHKKLDDIFTISSMMGSIKDGQLTDKWTFPGPSATNSALLWPGVAEHFCEIISRYKEAKL